MANISEKLWSDFAARYELSAEQASQFQRYYMLLKIWNEKFNLTTITDEAGILAYHFEDSVKLGDFYNVKQSKGIIDVGTGAGFPGIPLKILYPHVPVILIEVVQKKVLFLRAVIEELKLQNIEVCDMDWRTFLRQTQYNADLVCARASLRPDELSRMFQPSSHYKNATLVYWATLEYLHEENLNVIQDVTYTVGEKKRRYIFLRNKV